MIIGLNLIPILSSKFFPTLDGPAHLYNSQLIKTLLFEKNGLLNNFFIFNLEPVPNWTGHLVLATFSLFFPAFVAEKVLLLFYMIGLPLSFRALIKTVSTNNILFSYLIFPFTYSSIFFLGFYNFSIALVLVLFTLNFWIKNEQNITTIKNTLKLFSLIILIYFSHIFIFAILLFLIGIYTFIKFTLQLAENPNNIKQIFFDSVKKSGIILVSSIIPLFLFSYYVISRKPSGNYTFLSNDVLLNWIKNIRPIIALNSSEEVYTKKIFYLILSIFIIAVYNRINSIKINYALTFRDKLFSVVKQIFTISEFWLVSTIFILVLYFKLPDSDGNAGYVSVRLGLLFFLFLIIWLSTQKFPTWFGLFIVGIVLYLNFSRNEFYSNATKDLNHVALQCNEASKYILPYSVVLPLNFSDNWLHGHFSNYIGIDKPMVILENYECELNYFPIKWNDKSIPNLLLGNITRFDQLNCLKWRSNAKNTSTKIEYVFVLGNMDARMDSCNQKIKHIINENYNLIYHAESCKLFRAKKLIY